MPKRKPIDDMMAEHIRLPGAPQIVVTRAWSYDWLKKQGCPLQGGFGSLDYLVFGSEPVDEELTDLSQPWAKNLVSRLERHFVN